MEIEEIDPEQLKYNCIEDCMYNKCGEIIINDNESEVEFNLVCLQCGILSQNFDDFRNHFINEHYNLDKDSQTLIHLKDSSKSNVLLENYKDFSNDFNSTIQEEEHTGTFSSKFKESYENEKKNENFSYSEDSNDLEPEIKIQKYGSSDEESFILNNSSEYFNSDNDTRISGSTSTICGNSEYVVSCPKQDILRTDNCCDKKIKSNSNFSFQKNKSEEKTIEIYKEDYIPEKPKFILAAVNLPIKSNISKNSDDSLSTTDADPEAFPQDEVVSNNEVIDKECKPKFKFNNIKFRRHHNEKYYLSIEKTLNEKDGFFYCPECFKRYKRIESLRYHYLSHTGVPAPYQCSICHKGFPSAYKVRIHFTKHTGERPFRCHLCPRVYRHKQQLKFHLETHNDSNFNSHEMKNNINETS